MLVQGQRDIFCKLDCAHDIDNINETYTSNEEFDKLYMKTEEMQKDIDIKVREGVRVCAQDLQQGNDERVEGRQDEDIQAKQQYDTNRIEAVRAQILTWRARSEIDTGTGHSKDRLDCEQDLLHTQAEREAADS